LIKFDFRKQLKKQPEERFESVIIKVDGLGDIEEEGGYESARRLATKDELVK